MNDLNENYIVKCVVTKRDDERDLLIANQNANGVGEVVETCEM